MKGARVVRVAGCQPHRSPVYAKWFVVKKRYWEEFGAGEYLYEAKRVHQWERNF